MGFYINDKKISLKEVENHINETDLIPSRLILKENITDNFQKLSLNNIKNLAQLRFAIKNSKNIVTLSKNCSIKAEYLTLLKREIEGYFPKAIPLTEYRWFSKTIIEKLLKVGLKTNVEFYSTFLDQKDKLKIFNDNAIDLDSIDELFKQIDLSRIQWVSPTFSRILLESGYHSVEKVAKASSEKLLKDIENLNNKKHYYKGRLGIKDIDRLITAAKFVCKMGTNI